MKRKKIAVNMGEAKSRLSGLIEAVEKGHQVIIARNGEPVVELAAIRKPGTHPELRVGPEFFGPVAELDGMDGTCK